MATFLCERCGEQFSSQTDYQEHKVAHMMGRIKDKSVDELMGKEPEPQETQDIIAEPIVEKPKQGQKKASTPRAKWQNTPKQPIKLTYNYVGGCPDCGGELETLTVDDVVADKNKEVVVAWCFSCKKKLRQRIVAKL